MKLFWWTWDLPGLNTEGMRVWGLKGSCVGGGTQVVMVLKKEIMKTQSKELEKGAEYRQMLVQVRRHAPLHTPITVNQVRS